MNALLTLASVLEAITLLLLLFLSLWSFAIIVDRYLRLRLPTSGNLQVLKQQLQAGTSSSVSFSAQSEELLSGTLVTMREQKGRSESVEQAVRSYLMAKRIEMEKGLSVLATLGANAPFIGLFGTVLGIIQAFAALGNQNGQAQEIMTGVSRALFATAAGLFVAIPAVVAFNYFTHRIKKCLAECESLTDFYLSQMK